MKKNLLFITCKLALITGIFAQDTATLRKYYLKKADETVAEKVKLDFAVPDIPAFKALGIDPSNILRPSAAKDFSVMVSNFAGTGFSGIPKNAAVEIAPALLLKPWYTLQQYRQDGGLRMLTKSRISFGTNQDAATSTTSAAFGLRTTFFDRGDYRLDIRNEKQIYATLDKVQTEWGKRVRENTAKIGVVKYSDFTSSRRKEIEDSIFLVVQSENDIDIDLFIKESITTYKKENWNASRMDFAYALMLQSADSLISNIKVNRHSFWTTLALKPGAKNNWAQILLGLHNATYHTSGKWYNEFTGSIRFYGGTNKFKGLFEVQYQNINNPTNARINTLFTQLGIEVGVYSGVWIQFSTGIINALEGNSKSALRNNLNLALAFPENFQLF